MRSLSAGGGHCQSPSSRHSQACQREEGRVDALRIWLEVPPKTSLLRPITFPVTDSTREGNLRDPSRNLRHLGTRHLLVHEALLRRRVFARQSEQAMRQCDGVHEDLMPARNFLVIE